MLRVTTEFTGPAGSPWYSQMDFDGEETSVQAQLAHDAVAAFWEDLEGLITSGVSYSVLGDVEHVDLQDQTIAVFGIQATLGAGLNSAQPAPYANQGLIQWRTGSYTGGRELRGRTFIPGLASNAVLNGVWSGPVVAGMQAAADTLVENGEAGLAVFSPTKSGIASVQSATARNLVAVLRSRRD